MRPRLVLVPEQTVGGNPRALQFDAPRRDVDELLLGFDGLGGYQVFPGLDVGGAAVRDLQEEFNKGQRMIIRKRRATELVINSRNES